MLSAIGVPQSDGIVSASTCDCESIGTEGNTMHPTCMPSEQGDFTMGRGIVEPNTDIAGDGKPRAVW